MTKQDIIRALRLIRYSPQGPRRGRTLPGLRSTARAAGLSHMTLYRALETGQLSERAASALGKALET
jgi:hypothetical protein